MAVFLYYSTEKPVLLGQCTEKLEKWVRLGRPKCRIHKIMKRNIKSLKHDYTLISDVYKLWDIKKTHM